MNISGSWRHVSISRMFSVLQERQIQTVPPGTLQMVNCAEKHSIILYICMFVRRQFALGV